MTLAGHVLDDQAACEAQGAEVWQGTPSHSRKRPGAGLGARFRRGSLLPGSAHRPQRHGIERLQRVLDAHHR